MSNTSLGYCGNVEIKTKTKRARCHNNGTKNLFRLLTSFLAGDDVDTNNHLPAYIALYNRPLSAVLTEPETNEHQDRKLLVDGYIPLIAQSFAANESSTGQYCTQFEGVIDYKCVRDIDPDAVTLALVSNDQKHILAAVNFNEEDEKIDVYKVIKEGGLATIFWNLTFENIKEESV